jgi:riboflavin kinase/FMN adenylyltransferase
MDLYPGIESARRRLRPGGCFTVGTFDGVHLGHQRLVALLDEMAGDGPAVVLTFRRHPLCLLRPRIAPEPLTSVERRLALLSLAGADAVILVEFDPAFAALTAEELLRRLVDELGMTGMARGYDHRFGSDHADAERLGELAVKLGVRDEVLEPVTECGLVVKSKTVRLLLAEGDVSRAACLLGKPHRLSGRVVRGLGLARKLGFPTANVPDYYEMAPKAGVYAVEGRIIGHTYRGVANIGWRPTVGNGQPEAKPVLEVHLFDQRMDAYGAAVAVDFHARLRDEVRFPDLDALKAQIELDVQVAGDWWGAHPAGVKYA